MSYEDFTLETVRKRFGLTIESNQDLFSGTIHQVPLAEAFTGYLNYSVQYGLYRPEGLLH
ncbi:MAG: hypothetical protein HC922_08165 [Leptolyngbyaceae cyanobacterium SM2_3_12]|nr:hypothetical protein [Leptolyngbyaceae cyanobacterium SM2_3_12]